MKAENTALLGHINELRRMVVEGSSATTQYEAAVMLIDVYEQMLTNIGLLKFDDENKH
jgi:hypothetical protein